MRDVAPLAGRGPGVWRIALRPSSAASLAARITASGGSWMMDGGGAVLWATGEPMLAAERRQGETWVTLKGKPVAVPERPEMARVRAVLDPGGIFAGT